MPHFIAIEACSFGFHPKISLGLAPFERSPLLHKIPLYVWTPSLGIVWAYPWLGFLAPSSIPPHALVSCERTCCLSWTRICHSAPHLRSSPISWWPRIMRRTNALQAFAWPKLEAPSQIGTHDPTRACAGSQAWVRNRPSHIASSYHLWHSQGHGACTSRCSWNSLEQTPTQGVL